MADSANAQCDHEALTTLNAEYLAPDNTWRRTRPATCDVMSKS
jgi:hypothetical protein